MEWAAKDLADRVGVQRVNVLTGEGRRMAGELQVDTVPTVLLFDRTGRERYREYGMAVRRGDLRRVLDDLEAQRGGYAQVSDRG